jgi:HlyD family secretion protein
LQLEEGQILKKGDTIGYVDSTQLVLKRKQLQSQIAAVLSRNPDRKAQLAALDQQIIQAKREKQRIENMAKDGAATVKQLDDALSQLSILESQANALKSSLDITSRGLSAESTPLEYQTEQIKDQIAKCTLINPVDGTVLTQYIRENEMAITGKPLYKIADLTNIILRVYITGDQLPDIRIGQEVKVLTDDGRGGFKEYPGTINWISQKAEFTPKTIQTKEERANLVYAIKITVPNDGSLKIGMYGEVKFSK